METPNESTHTHTPHPPPNNPSYLIPISVLLLALTLPFFPPLPSNLLSSPNPNSPHSRTLIPSGSPFCLLWMAPFLSGGGYSSEAWSYITSLPNPNFKLAIQHHGDLESLDFWQGLPDHMRSLAVGLHQTQCRPNETIVVCHSEPGAWNPPLFDTWPCPPTRRYRDFLAVIGRTMFETDRVNPEHVRRCNRMDFVWVPTEFHVSSFVRSGIDKAKVLKLIQPVDVQFFDPDKHRPLDVESVAKLVLGKPASARDSGLGDEFVFFSVFKWEYRKGWDVLLRAYLAGFTGADNVALYLLTNPYHTQGDFDNKIVGFVEDSGIDRPGEGWARIYVIDTHVSQVDLPRLYRSADAFVLPSRGEGWGRPIVEAMAMAMPVIATNWSGPTEYLSEDNSYPLEVERMSEVMEGPFKGHLWAEPSVDRLKSLMRHVKSNPEEAKTKGRCAREDMIRRFSPEIVAEIVSNHVHAVFHDKIPSSSK